MAFNGSGVFVRLYNWVNDRNAAIKIRADRMDGEMDGFATGLSNCITKDGQTTITQDIPFNNKRITGLADATADTDAVNRQTGDSRYRSPTAQCRLALSGGNLLLSPFGGNRILIDTTLQTIPSAGVSLAATSLTPSTLYYIYAYMNSTTMTLEASTTAFSVSTTTGMPFKTGDATRTLVGMAMPDTGPVWVDSDTRRWVASYWNRKPARLQSGLTGNQSTTSGSYNFFAGDLTFSALCWTDGKLALSAQLVFFHSAAAGRSFAEFFANSVGLEGVAYGQVAAAADPFSHALHLPTVTVADNGLVSVELRGKTNTGTVTWLGAASAPDRTAILGMVEQ